MYVCHMKLLISTQKQLKSERMLAQYEQHLNDTLKMFYEQVGDDETHNEKLYKDFNMMWKRMATDANRTQKHTHIDVFAFEKEIEKLKQIALQTAITQQENGHDQNEANSNGPTGAEQGTN